MNAFDTRVHRKIFNAVHGLARLMNAHREASVQALMMLKKYIVSIENKGFVMHPKETQYPI